MKIDSIANDALSQFSFAYPGAFYGDVGARPVGAGIILDNVAYPTFDEIKGRFSVVSGLVYILTHECDISQDNDRSFNEHAVICPVIPLEHFFDAYNESLGYDRLYAAVMSAARNEIFRLFYLPPTDRFLEIKNGAIIYFNYISHTHVSELKKGRAVCSLSEYGLQFLDGKFTNHFLRPKDGLLPVVK